MGSKGIHNSVEIFRTVFACVTLWDSLLVLNLISFLNLGLLVLYRIEKVKSNSNSRVPNRGDSSLLTGSVTWVPLTQFLLARWHYNGHHNIIWNTQVSLFVALKCFVTFSCQMWRQENTFAAANQQRQREAKQRPSGKTTAIRSASS
jgi:hypothetical protein